MLAVQVLANGVDCRVIAEAVRKARDAIDQVQSGMTILTSKQELDAGPRLHVRFAVPWNVYDRCVL